MQLRDLLAPIPTDRRPARGFQLLAGLVLYGVSDAMLVLGALGLDPWDVLQQGLARSVGLTIGMWANLVGLVVLLCWIPLRQLPGVGTVVNVLVIGTVIDLTLAVTDTPHAMGARMALLVGGIVINAIATGMYIGAGLGPGPRDGLTTGIAARGHSIRVVRTSIEVAVLATGWVLGGTVGIGTLAYALAIGPLTHLTIPWLALTERRRNHATTLASADG